MKNLMKPMMKQPEPPAENAEVRHGARGKRTETTEDDAGGVGLH